jgi:hypothetical protein
VTGVATPMRSAFDAGFELNPIQRQAAVATASKWRDAIVTGITPDGYIDLVDLATDRPERVWHYLSLSPILGIGEPVSVHGLYGVLAVGSRLVSVRTAAPAN